MSQSNIETVKNWWHENPQLYGDAAHQDLDTQYFDLIDQGLFNYRYDGGKTYGELIEALIEPEKFAGKRGLEIGYGSGWLMEWLTRKNLKMTGMDLTERAFQLTSTRFKLRRLEADLRTGDARALPFSDATFDLVCSIGVLHHSPDTAKSISEVYRVLVPGGKTVMMLYSRDSVFSLFVNLIRGWFEMERKFLDSAALWNRWTDGWEHTGNAWTTPFTQVEIKQLFKEFSSIQTVSFYFDFPHPVSRLIPGWIKRAISRRFGWFRYIIAYK